MRSPVTCDDLSAVLRDQRRGHPPSPAAAEHLAGCSRCRQALVVDAALQRVAVAAPSRLPTAGSVLLRARLAARCSAAEKSQAPLLLGQALILTVAMAGVAFVLGAGLPTFVGASASGAPDDLSSILLAGGMLAILGLPFVARWRTAFE